MAGFAVCRKFLLSRDRNCCLEVDYTGAWCHFTTLFLITLSSKVVEA